MLTLDPFGELCLLCLRFSTGENWNGFMHNVQHNADGCVNGPEYEKGMCGFDDGPGCEELNGCGSSAIFPFLLTFTLLVYIRIFKSIHWCHS